MPLKNRKIKCEISRTIQENQYEPFTVSLGMEGDISDADDRENEIDGLIDFLEETVDLTIQRRMT